MLTDHAEFAAATKALDEAFVRLANSGEVDQLVAAYYADDAQVLPPNVPPVHGHGQIRELLREMIEAGMGDLTLDTRQFHVAGDLGFGIGSYMLALRPPEGKPRRDNGKYVVVYRRQADGLWKVAIHMFSSDLPAR